MAKVFYRLDRPRVRAILREQSLKRWWVAESAGVHKTTLRRWLNGAIDKIESQRLESLAVVLEVRQEEIARMVA